METLAENRAQRLGVEILHMSEDVTLHRSGMEFEYDGEGHGLKGVRFNLPDGLSRLVYSPQKIYLYLRFLMMQTMRTLRWVQWY